MESIEREITLSWGYSILLEHGPNFGFSPTPPQYHVQPNIRCRDRDRDNGIMQVRLVYLVSRSAADNWLQKSWEHSLNSPIMLRRGEADPSCIIR